jgi:hypothetical protein
MRKRWIGRCGDTVIGRKTFNPLNPHFAIREQYDDVFVTWEKEKGS